MDAIIQNRRGDYSEVIPENLRPGEYVVVQQNDPNSDSGQSVYVGIKQGVVKRLAFSSEVGDYNIQAQEAAEQAKSAQSATATMVGQVNTKYNEINTLAGQVATNAQTAQTAAQTATTKADEASQSKTDAQTASQTSVKVLGSMAPAYDATKTYAVGDLVIYDNTLYQCTTAITTPEAWNASHWTASTVEDQITDLKEDLNEAVRFDIVQDKTESEKTTALNNIGGLNKKYPLSEKGKALVVGSDGNVTTGEAGISGTIKVALMDIFKHIVYKDSAGKTAYESLAKALDINVEPTWVRVKVDDILDNTGTTNLKINDNGITYTPVGDFHAIVLPPTIKRARFNFQYNTADFPYRHSYVAKINNDGKLYVTTGTANFIFTPTKVNNQSYYHYAATQNDSILNFTKHQDRQDAFIELALEGSILKCYDSQGVLLFEVGEANCIGIWGSTGLPCTNFDIEIEEQIRRPATMSDLLSYVGYQNPSFTNGVFSHSSTENSYSAIVFNKSIKRLNAKIAMAFGGVAEYPNTFVVSNANQDGNLQAFVHANQRNDVYTLTLNSAENRYIATKISSTVLHRIKDYTRNRANCYFCIDENKMYMYNEQGILAIVENVDTVGVWSASPAGHLAQFEAEVIG